jgi:hypothetical protein
MEDQIIVNGLVWLKLADLEIVLYKKGYFGFQDSSKKYVDKIVETIYSIPTLKHRETKSRKHGRWFVTHYVANKRTQYKITFDKKDNRYIVRNIITANERAYKSIIGSL